jgi:hypothetical protein
MFCYKIHETQFGNLIAICDNDLNGKTLDNNGIEFFVNPRFYCYKTAEENILNIISKSNDGNVIGNKIVNLLLKSRLISKDTIILIDNVKHAQFTIL